MERVVFDLTRALMLKGHNVSVLCPNELIHFFGATGARIIAVPLMYKSIGQLIAAIELSVIGEDYDIVHIHGEGGSVIRTLAIPCCTKTIITLHGGENLYFTQKHGAYPAFMRMCLNFAASQSARIVAVSMNAARSFTRFKNKTSIVPNGIDVDCC